MPRELTRQLDDAVAEVFAVMLNQCCTLVTTLPSAPSHQASEPDSASPTYSASVQFSGSLEGICTIHLNQRTAVELTSALTGLSPTEIPLALCSDTAGELCNMIAGCWKTSLAPIPAASQLSCPQVTIDARRSPTDRFRENISLLFQFNGYHLTLDLAYN